MSVRTLDVAYDYLKSHKGSVSFRDLWKVVKEQMGYDDNKAQHKISQFYTDLSLDGRFTSLENNEWDLKSKHRFDEVVIDTESLMDDDSDEVEVDEEADEIIEESDEDEY